MRLLPLLFLLLTPFITLQAQITANPSDSLRLVTLYNAWSGEDWRNNDNWLSQAPVTEWFGVQLDTNGFVTHLELADNLLRGNIRRELGDFTQLEYLDLNGNELEGALTSNIFFLPRLRYLDLSQNALSGEFPSAVLIADELEFCDVQGNNFDELVTLQGSDTLPGKLQILDLRNNRLFFDDLRFSTRLEKVRYVPQQPVGEQQEITLTAGESTVFDAQLVDFQLTYQWYKDGDSIPGATERVLSLNQVDFTDAGLYTCQMNHPDLPELTITLNDITLRIDNSAERRTDSLALVALYQATGGQNWIDNDGWLEAGTPLEQWTGVTLTGNRVTRLSLGNNFLKGELPDKIRDLSALTILNLPNNELSAVPADISRLFSLVGLDLSGNKLTSVPASMAQMQRLEGLELSDNQLTEIPWLTSTSLPNLISLYLSDNFLETLPDLAGHPSLRQFQVLRNLLVFSEVEKNLNQIEFYFYAPQQPLGQAQVKDLRAGSSLSLQAPLRDTTYHYQWFRSGVPLPNDTLPEINLSNIQEAQEGDYICRITYDSIPELTLETAQVAVFVNTSDEARADSLALIAFYQAMDGENWTQKENWLSQEPIQTWFGVSAEGGRVTALDLPDNQLDGTLPDQMGDWTRIRRIDLSGNIIRQFFPNTISAWEALEELDLSDSRDPQNPGDQTAGLRGFLPNALGTLTRLEKLNLSDCRLTGGVGALARIPLIELNLAGNNFTGSNFDALVQIESLRSLDLSRNEIEGIPDFGRTQLQTLRVADNRLTFGSLEPNRMLPEFSYAPQAAITEAQIYSRKPGERLTLEARSDGTEDRYLWQQDGQSRSQNPETLTFDSLKVSDQGVYRCFVSNPLLPDLTLRSADLIVFVVSEEDLAAEKEALRAFYDSLGGDLWNVRQFWFSDASDDLERWFGIDLNEGGRIQSIRLTGNNLIGNIPAAIEKLEALEVLELSRNQIESIPIESLRRLRGLREIYLDDCQLTDLPGFTGFANLEVLSVERNALTFTPLLRSVGAVPDYRYTGQDSVGTTTLLEFEEDERIFMEIEPLPDATDFQWYKNDTLIRGAEGAALSIRLAEPADGGRYNLHFQNEDLPGLSLINRPVFVVVNTVVTGTEPAWGAKAKLYPNPAREAVRIELPQHVDAYTLRLTDLNGRMIYQTTGSQTRVISLPLADPNLPSGVYLLQLTIPQEGTLHFKLNVQR